jgi:transposase
MAESPEKALALEEEIARLRAEIERLRAENEKLKALLEAAQRGQKRQAAPFSKGPPKPDPKPPGRKPGGDYGTKAFRSVPPRIDEVLNAPLPEKCPRCGGGVTFVKTAEQYQTEIPKVQPVYRKFNVDIGCCACCGKRVQGRHPLQTSNALGAAKSQMGSNAQALVTRLNKHYGLSHGKAVGLMSELCQTALSRGASAQIMLRAAARCGNAYKEIQIFVRQSRWCVPDETGWRVGGKLQWLHVFVTEMAALYLIRPSRGFDVAAEALGADYDGDLVHDGWAPYEHFEQARHGDCTAHLLRRCKHLLEMARGAAVIFPRLVKGLLQEGLAARDAREAGELSQKRATAKAERLSRRLAAACVRKSHAGNERLANFLENRAWDVFNYLRYPHMDATNWRAEQALRPAVVNRKVWGGNRTARGAEAQGILMSVLRTAAGQGKEVLEYLAETLRAPPGHAPRLIDCSP